MRKTLLASTAFVVLGLSGNAIADPEIDGANSGDQRPESSVHFANNAASSPRTNVTGSDPDGVTSGATVLQDSFNHAEAVAPSRLGDSVSYIGIAGARRMADNDGDTRDSLNSRLPPDPHTADSLANTFSSARVASDAAASLSIHWPGTGQYELSFMLTARN
jgi:hypothetical protein